MSFNDNRTFDEGIFMAFLKGDLRGKKNLLGYTHVCGRDKINHFTIYG